MTDTADQALLAEIKAAGYVLIKAESYRRAQERQRIAEALKKAAEQDAERTRAWAVGCHNEERRLANRLTFVYGVAKAHGATDDELRGSGD